MVVKFFLVVAIFCSCSYSAYTTRVHKLRIDSAETATNPNRVIVGDSGSDTLEWFYIDSLSVAHADHADSAEVAFKALLTVHGVTPGTVPKAATDSTFTNSHISENGDTAKVMYVPAASDTFTASGISIPSTIYAGCMAPNGDCYFAIQYGGAPGFYIQTGGSGALSLVTSFASETGIYGMTADPSGNIYGARYCTSPGCWIYRRTGGAGNFDTLSGTRKTWLNITCDKIGVLYGLTNGDTIYSSVDSGLTWSFFQKVDDAQFFSNVAPDGSLYLTVRTSMPVDIYRKRSDDDQFYAMGLTGIDYWSRIGVDTSGNIFVSTATARGTYISTDNLSSIHKIQGKIFSGFVPKINGDIYGYGSELWLKTASPSKVVFAVYGGDAKFAGRIEAETELTNVPQYAIVKNVSPDEEFKKISVVNLMHALGKVDSATVADSAAVAGGAYHGVTPLHIAVAKDATHWKTTTATIDTVYGDAFFGRNLYVGDTTTGLLSLYMGALGTYDDVDLDRSTLYFGTYGGGVTARGAYLLLGGNEAGAQGQGFLFAGDSGDAGVVSTWENKSVVSGGRLDFNLSYDGSSSENDGLSLMWNDVDHAGFHLFSRDTSKYIEISHGFTTGPSFQLQKNKMNFACDTFAVVCSTGSMNGTFTFSDVNIDTLDVGLMRVGGGSNIIDIHRRTDTLVIKLSATDSLCFKAVAP